MPNSTPPGDFPLIPRPPELIPETLELLQRATEALSEGGDDFATEHERIYANALTVLMLEYIGQMEWRNQMTSWIVDLVNWLDHSPNVRRVDNG